jgi:L-ascorbate metabolism protein UlaG (beta-lactamase superfamily)
MELTWYGRTCIRLRGKEAVVVNDPYPSIVGPTGRGITADVITFSHPDDSPMPRKVAKVSRDGGTAIATSLESAFVLDGPGEYEVHDALVTGVRTYRDDARGGQRGRQTAFMVELDGIHTIHLGDIGHQLTEEKLADIGRIAVACVPVGGALTATGAAALVAQLDPRIVIPMPVCEVEADCDEAVRRFLHEMGAERSVQPRLSVTASSLPPETTTVLLESRGKA